MAAGRGQDDPCGSYWWVGREMPVGTSRQNGAVQFATFMNHDYRHMVDVGHNVRGGTFPLRL